jgi:hypothetical protein
MDEWINRLKAAYDAGYYTTEAADGAQTPFPWQNKSCRDCPFWANSVCQVHAEYRGPLAHTCIYFDAANRPAAQSIIQGRRPEGVRRWWEWFNDRGAMR